jgi:hypothetical protein
VSNYTTPTARQVIAACLSRPTAYHRIFARIGGGALAGLFLSQLWYWSDKGRDADGWIYKTQAEWQDEIDMTRDEQETARKALRKRGLIEEVKRGLPAKLFYRIDQDAITAAIVALSNEENDPPTQGCGNTPSKDVGMHHPCVGESTTLECGDTPAMDGGMHHAITENTSRDFPETTPEKTTTVSAPKVVTERPVPVVVSIKERDSDPNASLIASMANLGVDRKLAAEWADTLKHDKLQGLITLCKQQRPRVPGAWFRAAISQGFTPPPPSEAEIIADQNKAIAQAAAEKIAAEKERDRMEHQAREDRFLGLSDIVRERLTARVMSAANALQRRLMCGPAGRAVLVSRCLDLLNEEVELRVA